MPDQDLETQHPLLVQAAGGVDEQLSEISEQAPGFASARGIFPVFHEVKAIREPSQVPNQGTAQRLFGKKLIDANPNQKVMAIAQAYNGFGQYGYYVQTDSKLYFHQCETPKDVHINWSVATLQLLGTDSDGNSLNIFGHQDNANQLPPDTSISCVFDYPSSDKPPASNAGHAGVDYLLVTLTPAAPTLDIGLRTRLVAENTTTPYDGNDIGYYGTQNACRLDSVPLIDGPDADYEFPPTNSKTAFLAWGGAIAKQQTWVEFVPLYTGPFPHKGASNQITYVFANDLAYNDYFAGQTGVNEHSTIAYEISPGRWLQFDGGVTVTVVTGPVVTWCQNAQPSTVLADVGKFWVDKNDLFYYVCVYPGIFKNPVVPNELTFANAAARLAATSLTTADVGKVAKDTDTGRFWVLTAYTPASTQVSYLINLNRLFTDYQSLAMLSLNFLIRAFWNAKGGSGDVSVDVKSYKGGSFTRTGVVWGLTGATLVQTLTQTKNCVTVSSLDIKGKNLARITVTLADGTLNITTPTANVDETTVCPV